MVDAVNMTVTYAVGLSANRPPSSGTEVVPVLTSARMAKAVGSVLEASSLARYGHPPSELRDASSAVDGGLWVQAAGDPRSNRSPYLLFPSQVIAPSLVPLTAHCTTLRIAANARVPEQPRPTASLGRAIVRRVPAFSTCVFQVFGVQSVAELTAGGSRWPFARDPRASFHRASPAKSSPIMDYGNRCRCFAPPFSCLLVLRGIGPRGRTR